MKQNLTIENSLVQRNGREALNGHKGRALWFTGLSGSGKSTLARSLEQELHSREIRTFLLDGDNLRRGLSRGLGFSNEDREENIRRAAEVCRLMVEAGIVVLAAFISPLASHRAMAKKIIGEQDFEEIFV
ncbi:adenylyl-sulfate kinase, partial [bacterium]|nr:adenylyl-sulfate kinase [bacterium]